jgi:phosphoribosylcarboxyaminoimidazole (NCAIR) mutase
MMRFCHVPVKCRQWNYPADLRVTTTRTPRGSRKKATTVKNFGFATIIATAFAAALVGLAGPAAAAPVANPAQVGYSAGIDHHQWINDIQQQVNRPPAPIVGNGR